LIDVTCLYWLLSVMLSALTNYSVSLSAWVLQTDLYELQPPSSTQPGHPSVGRCSEYRRKL